MGSDKTRKPATVRLASDQRTIEYWNSLWSHGDSLVWEVGDEEGKYAVQEVHWEPPYFDGYTLASDLDPIAANMLGLIDDVYDLVDNPDLFYGALSSYLRRENKATWYPETSLLLDERRYYHEDNKEDVSRLLESWASVSKKMGNKRRSVASELQSVIFRAPEDWDAIIGNYKKHRNPEEKKAIDPLFAHWQTKIARRSVGHVMDASALSDTWAISGTFSTLELNITVGAC